MGNKEPFMQAFRIFYKEKDMLGFTFFIIKKMESSLTSI